MNRLYKYILIVIALSLTTVSCKKGIDAEGYGFLCVDVLNDRTEELVVKSSAPVTEPYIIEVYDESGSLVAREEDHTRLTADNPMELLMGTYTVKAMNLDMPDASFDTDYFAGEKKISIKPEELNEFSMTCRRQDCRFSVSFPDDFADMFKVYEVTVSNGEGAELVLSNTPDASDPTEAPLSSMASLKVTGELTWSLYMKNMDSADSNEEGGIYTFSKTYTGVKAGQRYHLEFSLAEPEEINGVFALRVVVDGEMIEQQHDVQIDFDQKDKPSFSTNENLVLPENEGEYITILFEDGSERFVSFSTPAGLRNMIISHYDEDLARAGVPSRTDLCSAGQDIKDQITLLGIGHNVGEYRTVINLTNFIKTLPEGKFDLSLTAVDKKGRYARCDLPLEIALDVDAEAIGATAWAMFATMEARYFADDIPEGLTFQYRNKLDPEWITLDASKVTVNTSAKRYAGRADGLEPGSEYIFRAVSAADIEDGRESKELTFSTEGASDIHNLSFDYWWDKGSYWMPNESSDIKVWDSANSSGMTTTTSWVDDDVVSGKAARLESLDAAKFAAGNIFTGEFKGVTVIPMGAELYWGVPFKSRPIALKGYYKYSPKEISHKNSPYNDISGMDQGQILMCLTDWSDRFVVSTGANQFVNFDTDPGIIAFGAVYPDGQDSDYVEFTIPLVYRSLTRIPEYVVIAGASSRYGDYFTGGAGSVLLLDEFRLVYDPAELEPEEFEMVFSNFN